MRDAIENLLAQLFSPTEIRVIDQSHLHAGHAESPGKNSHFRVIMTSDHFNGKTLIQKHRMVQEAVFQEFPTIHALSMKLEGTE